MKKNKLLNEAFTQNLIHKIKEEKINQIPKYIFLLKNFLVILFLIFSIIIGAIAFSISFDYLMNADWYLINKLGLIKVMIIFLPFFWILFSIFASLLSYYNFRHTQRGYKFSLIQIIGINIGLSLLLGVFLFLSGANNLIESKIENYVPKYRSLLVEDKISRMIGVWQNEESGLILGRIIQMNNNVLYLNDYNNKNWTILLNEKTEVKGKAHLIVGEKIKIVGEKINDTEFIAIQIRPFLGKNK